ncbi:MAG: hypothetical protein AAFV19_22070 [Pseudomonadota bacterium]
MKAFLAAIVATIVISFGADYLLNHGLDFAADQAFSLDGVSVPER